MDNPVKLIKPAPLTILPTQHSARLKAAWADFYGDVTALAVTLELFRKRLATPPPPEVAKAFFRALDRNLSGPRCGKLPAHLRTQGYLASEDWTFHPHLHGVVTLPQGHRHLPADPQAYIEDIWNRLYPSGSVKIDTLETAEKWLSYSTKRNGIYSHEVSHAFQFWSN